MIFDSDVLIWCLRGDRNAEEILQSDAGRASSIISIMEMFQGAHSKDEIKLIRGFILYISLQVIPVSEPVSYLAANLIEEYAHSSGIQLADALIAATARETGLTLVTANVRHFRSISQLALKSFRPAMSR